MSSRTHHFGLDWFSGVLHATAYFYGYMFCGAKDSAQAQARPTYGCSPGFNLRHRPVDWEELSVFESELAAGFASAAGFESAAGLTASAAGAVSEGGSSSPARRHPPLDESPDAIGPPVEGSLTPRRRLNVGGVSSEDDEEELDEGVVRATSVSSCGS
jgi:hypothetical protein